LNHEYPNLKYGKAVAPVSSFLNTKSQFSPDAGVFLTYYSYESPNLLSYLLQSNVKKTFGASEFLHGQPVPPVLKH